MVKVALLILQTLGIFGDDLYFLLPEGQKSKVLERV
jgi:hypothetical protein